MENLELQELVSREELSNLKGMLQSNDPETTKLAVSICKTIPEIENHVNDWFYFPNYIDLHTNRPVLYQLDLVKRDCKMSFRGDTCAYMFIYYHIIENILKGGSHIKYITNANERQN